MIFMTNKIYNPCTDTYYIIRTEDTPRGKKGTIVRTEKINFKVNQKKIDN